MWNTKYHLLDFQEKDGKYGKRYLSFVRTNKIIGSLLM